MFFFKGHACIKLLFVPNFDSALPFVYRTFDRMNHFLRDVAQRVSKVNDGVTFDELELYRLQVLARISYCRSVPIMLGGRSLSLLAPGTTLKRAVVQRERLNSQGWVRHEGSAAAPGTPLPVHTRPGPRSSGCGTWARPDELRRGARPSPGTVRVPGSSRRG